MDASIVDRTRLAFEETRKDSADGRETYAWPHHQKIISILVPTRGRSAMFCRMLDSLYSTADAPEAIEVIAYVDDDDAETLALDTSPCNVIKIVGPRGSMGRLNSSCYARSTGSIIMLGNDDVIVRTRGWDSRVQDETGRFADKVYLLYPNDLCKGRRICTFPILSRVACDAIGDPFPAEYRGAFIDVHVMDIFKRLSGSGYPRIAYLDDVIFEHMHYRSGKSEYDATYRERDRFGDDRTFLALNNNRARAAWGLKTVIDGSDSMSLDRIFSPRPADDRFPELTWNILRNASSPLIWRIRLFCWMWARHAYRYIKTVLPRNT